MKLEQADIEKVEQYLFIIKIIAERNNDEYNEPIELMVNEALKVLAKRFEEVGNNQQR